MPKDVNARIIVTTEASAARQGIDNVKNGLKGITDARERDLRIIQAKSQKELAAYRATIAAQKTYNAELQLKSAEALMRIRIKNYHADADEIKKRTERIQQLRGEILKLRQAETSANLQAHQSKVAYDNLLNPVDKATDGTKKLTAAQIAARAAGRALGIDLSGTSANMIKLGIIAAGAAAAVKLVRFSYDSWRKGFAEAADLEHRNSESMLEATERLTERIEKEKDALQTIEEFGNKQNRTVDETVKLSKAIRLLGGDFTKLADVANIAKGGIVDFSAASEAVAKKQYDKKLKQLQAAYNQLRADEDTEIRRRDTAGIPVWFGGDLRFGGEDEAKEAQEKINEIAARRMEIQRQINELKLAESERLKDQKVKEIAVTSVVQKNIDTRLKDFEYQREVQDLINSGMEREAEILKIRNQLNKEALSLKGKELEIFNARRAEIEKSMLESYDQKAAEIANKAAERAEKEQLRAAERAEKERLRAAERAEKERLRAAERGMKAEENAYKSLYDRIFSYRKTAQDAITSKSAEGIALQSRVFMNANVSMTDNPAKQTAAGVKELVKEQKEMSRELKATKKEMDSIRSLLAQITGNTDPLKKLKIHSY